MADYYELLGVSRRRVRRRHQEGLPPEGPRAAPRRQPRRPGRRGPVQGGRPGLRGAQSTPTQRARYDRFGEAGVGACGGRQLRRHVRRRGGLGDLFEALLRLAAAFGGGGRGPAGPPRGQDLEVVADIDFARSGVRRHRPVEVRTALALRRLRRHGRRPGTQPVTCSECSGRGQVRRVRQSMLGQMVTAGACPRCGGLGQVIVTPCPTCRGEGRVDRRAHLPRRRTRRGRHRLDAAAQRPRRGRPAGRPGRRPLRALRVPPARALRRATATTSWPSSRSPSPRPRSAPSSADHARRRRAELVVPAGTLSGRQLRFRGEKSSGLRRLDRRRRMTPAIRINQHVPLREANDWRTSSANWAITNYWKKSVVAVRAWFFARDKRVSIAQLP